MPSEQPRRRRPPGTTPRLGPRTQPSYRARDDDNALEVPEEHLDREQDAAGEVDRAHGEQTNSTNAEATASNAHLKMELMEEAQSQPEPIATDSDEFAGYFDRLQERRAIGQELGLVGAATGLSELDRATGGLQGITILGGQTQTGKTSLAAQMCLAALRHDRELAVVYFLLDNMTSDDLYDQIICCEARVDYQVYMKGKLARDEQQRVTAAYDRLNQEVLPRMHTFEQFADRSRGYTGKRLLDYCRRFMNQVRANRVMVIVDMFDDLSLPYLKGGEKKSYRIEVRKNQFDPDMWRLKQLCELSESSRLVSEGGWPILVLAKLRIAQHEEPEIEDLLGCVQLAYKADRIFFLIPEKSDAANPLAAVPTTLKIVKGRRNFGPSPAALSLRPISF